ncbi:hypothetical protein PIROE2DRAFT_16745 [Piromyces sp. E2]|nr:hypothetical protein PIROE2DRAFT_16745 [Piromyces sp. E2]|eukprot:OUM58078.1 hypothetical protein PIROE2DRAFT_16745 [Piromyces sp. E2]
MTKQKILFNANPHVLTKTCTATLLLFLSSSCIIQDSFLCETPCLDLDVYCNFSA